MIFSGAEIIAVRTDCLDRRKPADYQISDSHQMEWGYGVMDSISDFGSLDLG